MKKLVVYPFICLVFFASVFDALAQKNSKDSVVFIPMIQISYSYQLPGADLAKRFGDNSNIGLSFLIKNKNNWIYGLEGDFIFGTEIKENQVLKNISTKDGNLISANGQLAELEMFERGYLTQIKGGRLFSLLAPNKNSGFYFTLGLGMLQHKIRIENTGNTAPQIASDYKKGYDRLTNGVAISESFGYSFFSNNRRVNFYMGFDFYQAFTKNRRSFNYDSMAKDDSRRKDILNGFRIGWVIPLYEKLPNEFYYR